MWPARTGNLLAIFSLTVLVQVLLPTSPARADLRKVKVGDTMPEFSLPDPNGTTFTYKHGRDRVLILALLPTVQSRLERAVADVEAVVESFPEQAERLDFAGVISGPAEKDILKSLKPGSKLGFPILLDGEYQLWGTLGVIAAPTVLIVGKDDRILWIKAGYGYDFVPVARAYVNQALGIAQQTAPEDAQHVKAVTNDTVEARLQRHLQMAKILEQKGRLESAAAEIEKAAQLDPNSIEPALELGELFCRAGRSKAALELVEKLRAESRPEKSRLLLISGWAKRQMGDLESAEKLLLEATTLDPKSIRALFELGKVYRAKGLADKALESYHKALMLVFNESQEAKAPEQQQEPSLRSQK